jgi:GcrA cell cycle regulator
MAIDAEDRQVQRTGAPGRKRFDWSGASIALLRRRWAEGASARAIAKELGSGVSRCAVLGKVHRLELKQPEFKQRHGRKERVRARRPRPAAKGKRAGRREVSRLTAAFIALGLDTVFGAPDVRTAHQFAGQAFGAACGLLDLSETTCRWPIGEPDAADFAFCGAAPFRRYPYCVGHCLIAYRPDSGESVPREPAPARPARGIDRAA